jgi:hypothetical protein
VRGLAVAALAAALLGVWPAAAQTIDSIVVLNDDVFARDEEMDPSAGFMARFANALHIRTTAGTIRRTLLVKQGEAFDSARVIESARALRRLGVFRQVTIDTAWVNQRLYLLVQTADGWSTRPEVNFSTAGGDETWQVGVSEQNFLGTATEVSVGYRHTPDRNAFEVLYRTPHFVVPRAVFLARYSNYSDGERGGWRLGLPFAQTAARVSLETSGEAGRLRVLQFREALLDTMLQHRILRVNVRGGVALRATSRNYTRAWAGLTWRREDFADTGAVAVPRSTFGTAGAGIEVGHTRIRVVQHFNSYSRREDLDLSQVARFGAWVTPTAWGYPSGRAGVGPEASFQASTVWRGGFVVVRAGGHGVFAGSGLDSGRVAGSITVGSQNLRGHTLVLHTELAAAHNPAPGDEYDFWLDRRSGPRLFGAHAFTGTRLVWLTVEDRILIDGNFYGLIGVGVAPFLDWGGIWYPGDGTRTGGNVGLALRIGPTRAINGDPAEIAIGLRFGAGITTGCSETPAATLPRCEGPWALTIRRGIRF